MPTLHEQAVDQAGLVGPVDRLEQHARRWPRPGPGGRRTPPGRTSSPRPRSSGRPCPPPTLSRKAKNSAIAIVTSGRASSRTPWCWTAFQKTLVVAAAARSSRSRRTAVRREPRQLVSEIWNACDVRRDHEDHVERHRRDEEADDERILAVPHGRATPIGQRSELGDRGVLLDRVGAPSASARTNCVGVDPAEHQLVGGGCAASVVELLVPAVEVRRLNDVLAGRGRARPASWPRRARRSRPSAAAGHHGRRLDHLGEALRALLGEHAGACTPGRPGVLALGRDEVALTGGGADRRRPAACPSAVTLGIGISCVLEAGRGVLLLLVLQPGRRRGRGPPCTGSAAAARRCA